MRWLLVNSLFLDLLLARLVLDVARLVSQRWQGLTTDFLDMNVEVSARATATPIRWVSVKGRDGLAFRGVLCLF